MKAHYATIPASNVLQTETTQAVQEVAPDPQKEVKLAEELETHEDDYQLRWSHCTQLQKAWEAPWGRL